MSTQQTKGSDKSKVRVSNSREKPKASRVHRDQWVSGTTLVFLTLSFCLECVLRAPCMSHTKIWCHRGTCHTNKKPKVPRKTDGLSVSSREKPKTSRVHRYSTNWSRSTFYNKNWKREEVSNQEFHTHSSRQAPRCGGCGKQIKTQVHLQLLLYLRSRIRKSKEIVSAIWIVVLLLFVPNAFKANNIHRSETCTAVTPPHKSSIATSTIQSRQFAALVAADSVDNTQTRVNIV